MLVAATCCFGIGKVGHKVAKPLPAGAEEKGTKDSGEQ